jgi:hypothetical protein
MSKISGYTGPAYPFCSPIEAVTVTCTAPYNHRAVGFRNCKSAFHLAGMILGGRDVIEEFVAAEIWLISYGWAPTEILSFNVNWATPPPIRPSAEGRPECQRIHGGSREESECYDWRIYHE